LKAQTIVIKIEGLEALAHPVKTRSVAARHACLGRNATDFALCATETGDACATAVGGTPRTAVAVPAARCVALEGAGGAVEVVRTVAAQRRVECPTHTAYARTIAGDAVGARPMASADAIGVAWAVFRAIGPIERGRTVQAVFAVPTAVAHTRSTAGNTIVAVALPVADGLALCPRAV
jgi:hypothetical protein